MVRKGGFFSRCLVEAIIISVTVRTVRAFYSFPSSVTYMVSFDLKRPHEAGG